MNTDCITHPRFRIRIGLVGLALTAPVACAQTEGPAPAAANSRDEALLASARDEQKVALGRETYAAFCQACHGPEGNAVESPSNLFDRQWYHGGSPSAIERTIRDGILDKGMPPWGQMISDTEVEGAVAYILSFQASQNK